ncbi:GIY-YIG nuclease family protein [Roseovarius faecimaris]|uniref:GIY-YIG nuclease family protein n=1 Tax=Roseovarius faecimaris TaxID=2494550 RepID=A0A6I6ITP3_9RHOB|nr:GIY-YIG nuclease family protein [Roseovarius faecimaris]QGX99454.1 GIY-YIG nuclease family protein [Roseovarius faecimaris]
MAFYTYILTCHSNTATFIGVTGDLSKRVGRHKSGCGSEYTAKHNINKLVYFEAHDTLSQAFARERKLRRWRHALKDVLINDTNPSWSDLNPEASYA